jgi:transcriptional regulator with XRE-family HTH domain
MNEKSVPPKINVRWFKDQIERRGLSQRQIARVLGFNQSVISHMFRGDRRLKLEEAIKWAEILEVPLEEVLVNAGLPVSAKLSAILLPDSKSNPQSEIVGFIDEHFSVILHSEGVKVHNPAGQSAVLALRCQTSGRNDFDGALMFYSQLGPDIDPEMIGRLCLVKHIQSDRMIIRVVRRGYEAGRHNLALLNGAIKEQGVVLMFAKPILYIRL